MTTAALLVAVMYAGILTAAAYAATAVLLNVEAAILVGFLGMALSAGYPRTYRTIRRAMR